MSMRPRGGHTLNTINDTRICGYCDAQVEHWNLAPIDVLPDGSDYIFEVDLYVCDDCYDGHCTKYDIQPLE